MSTTTTIARPSTVYSSVPPQKAKQGTNYSTGGSTIRLQPLDSANAEEDVQPPADAFEAIPDGGYGWTIVAANAMFIFWSNGFCVTWGVLQANILKSTTMKVSTLTFVGSLAMACMVAFGLPSVRVLSKFGARRSCIIAAVLLSSAPILTSFTVNHLGGLFATSGVLVGTSASILYTASNSIPVQWFSGKLGTANGIIKAGGGVGATVLPIAAQALIDAVGLPWTYRIFGFLMAATVLPSAWLIRERTPMSQSSRWDLSIFKDAAFVCLCLAGATSTFALLVPAFFLPLFASAIGLPPATGAGLVAGYGAATTAGRIASGFACDKIGPFNTLVLTVMANALSMLAIWPVSSTLAPLVIFAAINGCGNGSFFVALPTAIATLVGPGLASSAMSMGCSFWAPGYLLGSPIAGFLISSTGASGASSIEPYRAAIFYAGGVALLSGLCALVARLKMNAKLVKRV